MTYDYTMLNYPEFATDELGEKFDIREFHDEVLGRGSVPLSVLDANIRTWVESRKPE